MQLPDKKIQTFILQHHVLTIASCTNTQPWCCACFYVYDKSINRFYVLSNHSTRHVQDWLLNNNVTGSILLETKMIGKIRGIQFSGFVKELFDIEKKLAKKKYLFSFPYAILTNTSIWEVEPTYIKYTDNRLGFGKKMIWEK